MGVILVLDGLDCIGLSLFSLTMGFPVTLPSLFILPKHPWIFHFWLFDQYGVRGPTWPKKESPILLHYIKFTWEHTLFWSIIMCDSVSCSHSHILLLGSWPLYPYCQGGGTKYWPLIQGLCFIPIGHKLWIYHPAGTKPGPIDALPLLKCFLKFKVVYRIPCTRLGVSCVQELSSWQKY